MTRVGKSSRKIIKYLKGEVVYIQGSRERKREEEKLNAQIATQAFVCTIKQIVPSYPRRILTFLAKNKEKKFTNIQIAKALDEDRSNIWRFLNTAVDESGEHSLVKRERNESGDVLYCWNEPKIEINKFKLSELLIELERLENNKYDNCAGGSSLE